MDSNFVPLCGSTLGDYLMVQKLYYYYIALLIFSSNNKRDQVPLTLNSSEHHGVHIQSSDSQHGDYYLES